MNKSYKTLLIGLLGYTFLWGLINSRDKVDIPQIEFGPAKVEAAGGVTICKPGAFGSDATNCADVVNGVLSTSATISGLTTIAQGTGASPSKAWTMVLTDGYDHTIGLNFSLYTTLTDGAGGTLGTLTSPIYVKQLTPGNLQTLMNCATVSGAASYTAGTNNPCTGDTLGNLMFSLGTALSGTYATTTPDSVQTYVAPTTTYSGGQTSVSNTSTQLFAADSVGFITTIQNIGTPATTVGICPFTPCVYTTAPFTLTQYQFLPSSVAMTWKGVWYAITSGAGTTTIVSGLRGK